MLTLALDTALQACSVAIVDGADVRARESTPLVKGHAEVLPPMAQRVLTRAGVKAADLDRVGVTIGPGGFTGVRVGLAFARALVLGVKAKTVGVGVMEALLATYNRNADIGGCVAPVLDARRGDVFAALFRDGAASLAPFCDKPEASLDRLRAAAAGAPVVLIGAGAALLSTPPARWRSTADDLQVDPTALARLAAAAPAPTAPPAPVYLRAPDADPGAPSIFDRIAKG